MKRYAHKSIVPACRVGLLLCAMVFSAPLLAQRDNASWHSQPGPQSKPGPWQQQHISQRQLAEKWEDKHRDRDRDRDKKDGYKKDRKRFESLPPEDREKLRERRELFKSLPPEERERIERAREKYHNLPPERREELKEKWRNMSPDERREYHRKMENDDRYQNYR